MAFHAAERAVWDGQPSLGGVWVASPTVQDPARVILRNPANGKSVVGALFRREQIKPGPALQISADAAAALGIRAGKATPITVTALRGAEPATDDAIAETPKPGPAPAVTPPPVDAARVQIGIFSREANARRAADRLLEAGLAATVTPGQGPGQPHWSVTASGAGPAAALVTRIKGLGFADAYLLQ